MPRPIAAIKMETFCVRAPSTLVKRLMRLFSEQSIDITWKDFVVSVLESGLAAQNNRAAQVPKPELSAAPASPSMLNFLAATSSGPVEQ